MEHPEPVEPPVTMLPDGDVYCLIHGEMNCDLPWCWRCGSHLMDDFERCADPRCHASNGPLAREVVERVRANWQDGPAPLEFVAAEIARAYADSPSFSPGEPGRGAVPEPSGSASGAGS